MHKEYKHITTPNQLISDMYEFVKECGYDVFEELTQDRNIYDEKTYDGLKFGIYNRNGTHFVQFRSANGINIFDKLDGEELNNSSYKIDYKRYSGVGLIASESFDKYNKWFIQGNSPMTYSSSLASGDISQSYACGCFMPLPSVKEPSIEGKEPELEEYYDNVMPVKPVVEYPEAPAPPEAPLPELVIRHYEDENDYDDEFTSGLVGEDGNKIKRMVVGDKINPITKKPYGNFIIFDKLFHKYSDDFVVVGYMKYGQTTYIPKDADVYETWGRFGINSKEPLTIDALNDDKSNKYTVKLTHPGYTIPKSADVNVLEEDVSAFKKLYGFGTLRGSSSGGIKYNFAEIRLIKHLKGGGSKFSGLSGACYLVAIPNDEWDKIVNAPALQDTYQKELEEYNIKFKAWQEECEKITEKHKEAIDKYNSDFYLYEIGIKHIKDYIAWIPGYTDNKYKEFLDYYNSLFDYTLYCNDSIGSDYNSRGNSLIFSLVKQPYKKILSINVSIDLDIPELPKELEEQYFTDKDKVAEYNEKLKKVYNKLKKCNEDIIQFNKDIRNKNNLVYDDTPVEGFFQTTHLAVCDIEPFDAYEETGFLISGSANSLMLDKDCYKIYDDEELSDKYTRPLFGSSDKSTTFMRVYNKEMEKRGIFWASSGTDKLTGSSILLPVRTPQLNTNTKEVIPSYEYLQADSPLSWGNNFTAVSGLTLRLTLYVCYKDETAGGCRPVGNILNAHYVSLWNMQTAGIYNFSYPFVTTKDQVFPFGRRRGIMGFDGVSIRLSN